MKLQAVLAKQFGFMYRVVAANVEGITQEQSLAQPAPGGNCANWVLGHLTNIQNGVMKNLDEKPVWESEQLARAGFDPIRSASEAIDWVTLRAKFLASEERCLTALERLSDQKMSEPVPHPFGGDCSRGELLATLAFHQAYHAGQLAVCRRIAGLDGVIKAPGQVEAEAVPDRK